jgi:hypothetical protein
MILTRNQNDGQFVNKTCETDVKLDAKRRLRSGKHDAFEKHVEPIDKGCERFFGACLDAVNADRRHTITLRCW